MAPTQARYLRPRVPIPSKPRSLAVNLSSCGRDNDFQFQGRGFGNVGSSTRLAGPAQRPSVEDWPTCLVHFPRGSADATPQPRLGGPAAKRRRARPRFRCRAVLPSLPVCQDSLHSTPHHLSLSEARMIMMGAHTDRTIIYARYVLGIDRLQSTCAVNATMLQSHNAAMLPNPSSAGGGMPSSLTSDSQSHYAPKSPRPRII